jgi:hypothetical protein
VKLDILLNGSPVDALASIVHRSKSQRVGRELVEKLKKLIDRQMFEVRCFSAYSLRELPCIKYSQDLVLRSCGLVAEEASETGRCMRRVPGSAVNFLDFVFFALDVRRIEYSQEREKIGSQIDCRGNLFR